MKKMSKWLAAGLLSLAGAVGVVGVSPVHAQTSGKSEKAEAKPTQDVLIFRNGTVKYGKIVSENATKVVFKGMAAGIAYETDFEKADILEIKRNVEAKETAAAASVSDVKRPTEKKEEPQDDGVTRTKYYWIDLKGDLGQEISETPIRKALLDAQKQGAEVVIFNMDANFIDPKGRKMEDFEGKFDQLFRATAIMQTLVNDVPNDFGGNPPRMVFWVKQAMGGPAFIPLVSKDIYFHPDGKLGGIGGLDNMKGHVRVVEKQISLRVQMAVGWALVGGYSEELVRGLALTRTVLSVRFENGVPVLFEGEPKNPGEELLTDDGDGINEDTIDMLARGLGNDVLTLDASLARRIGVSKGTAESKSDLLNQLGLDRGGLEVSGRSEQITKDWTRGLNNAKSQILKLMEEFRDIQVQGQTARERNAMRSAQINKLTQIKNLMKQWSEGLDVYWLARNGLPYTDEGQPNTAEIDAQIEAIRIAIMKDR